MPASRAAIAGWKAENMPRHFESEAIEALRETLGQISVIKVKDILLDHGENRGDRTILGYIEIYGHAQLRVDAAEKSCPRIEGG
jgi:hypothetical protein